jgi:hypothetical protein
MSLINDALKQAERDKADHLERVRAIELEPVEQPRTNSGWMATLLIIVGAVAAGAGTWLWMTEPWRGPQAASASDAVVDRAVEPTPQTPGEPPGTPATRPAETMQNKPDPTPQSAQLAAAAEQAGPKTASPAPKAARPAAAEPLDPNALEPADFEPVAVAAAVAAAKPAEDAPDAKPGDEPETKAAPRRPFASAGSDVRVVRPTTYVLTAVLQSEQGDTAVINGQFVQVGEDVDGAKVITIRRHAVELEVDGKQFRVQL